MGVRRGEKDKRRRGELGRGGWSSGREGKREKKRVRQQRREELRRRTQRWSSSAFRSTAVELHILVCRSVSPLVTENWNRPARLGSCSRRSCRRPGRAQSRSGGGGGCTGRRLSLGVGQGRRAGWGKGRKLKQEAQMQAWGRGSSLLG